MAATRRICLTFETRPTSREKCLCRGFVGIVRWIRRPFDENFVYYGLRDAFLRQLAPQGYLSARPRTIPTLDPRACKRLVVQVTHLSEALDNGVDKLLRVAKVPQPPPRLSHGARPHTHKRSRGIHYRSRIAELSSARPESPL
jgi:hypothetical protein